MEYNKLRNAINELINNNTDAKDGFNELAHAADDGTTRQHMLDFAEERGEFVNALKSQLSELGGTAKKKFNILDDLHRAWIDIKVNNSDDYKGAIRQEIIRGEEVAIEDYRKILEKVEMPESTRELLSSQADKISARLDKFKNIDV